MKCSGKQHKYSSEIESSSEEIKAAKFNEVINQVKNNKENLRMLDEKFKNEAKNITATIQSKYDLEEWKQQMKSFQNELATFQQQINADSEELNQKLRMG